MALVSSPIRGLPSGPPSCLRKGVFKLNIYILYYSLIFVEWFLNLFLKVLI